MSEVRMRPQDGQLVQVRAENIDGHWLGRDWVGVYLRDPERASLDRVLVPADRDLLVRGPTDVFGWTALGAAQFRLTALRRRAEEVEWDGCLGWRHPEAGALALWRGEWVGLGPAWVQQGEVLELAG